MTDLQPPSTAGYQPPVIREVSLLRPELSTSLVVATPPPLDPDPRSQDTHLLPSSGDVRRNAKRNAKRRLSYRQPKDSKVKRTVYAALALKAQGQKNADVAEALGITVNTLKVYMYRAHKRGWLTVESLEDPGDKLEIVMRSKAVRNIGTILDEGVISKKTNAHVPSVRAGEMSLEVAKGLGLLVNHQAVKSDVAPTLAVALSVNVEMPAAVVGESTGIRPGSLGGQPYFDAEVMDEE